MNGSLILIVEDEPSLARGLKDNFELQGCRLLMARNGLEGLEAARNARPDLILLDIMLPKMNGFEVCQALRKGGAVMPVIMLTAKGQEEDIIRGLELGADDYVTKPFRVRELVARVRAMLRRSPRFNENRANFGPFSLDFNEHQLRKDNQPIVLTAKELRLLEFFLARPGRAVTRNQILDGVWGQDIMVNDRSVDRCVATLRTKIEIDPHNPIYLLTLRDIGYRFDPG
jgi:DNA-binding response OmpR family regulator